MGTIYMILMMLAFFIHICFLFYVARNEGLGFMILTMFVPPFALYIYYRNWDEIKWLFPLHMGPLAAGMMLG